MRIIIAGVAAAFVFASTAGAMGITEISKTQAIKTHPSFELVKSTKKKMSSMSRYESTSGSRRAHKTSATRAKKTSSYAGTCGTGKYWSNGKCLAAADKKPKVAFPGMVRSDEDMK